MHRKIAVALLLGALPWCANAGQVSSSDSDHITANKISAMCSKMKPSVYTKNDAGTIIRKGCRFKNKTYTIIYEVDGQAQYVQSMKNTGIVNKNAKDGDPKEMKNYCKSYAWLYQDPKLTTKIVVEYRDTKGKLLASKFIETADCSKALQ